MILHNADRLRILVIDDNDSICKLLALLLQQEGFQVETALDGASAQHLLSSQSFHILIADLYLPDMRGDDLIERIRGQFPSIKTILISSHPDVMERAKACRADLGYVKGESVIALCGQVASLAATVSG